MKKEKIKWLGSVREKCWRRKKDEKEERNGCKSTLNPIPILLLGLSIFMTIKPKNPIIYA